VTAAVEVHKLVKRYRGAERNAIDGISFAVPEGAFVCLLGPNGAGKTTTVGVLTTMLSHTAGRARIAGRDVRTERAAVRREIGVVFQQPSLDLNLTAEENIRLHCALYGLYPWRPAYRLTVPAYRRQIGVLADVLGLGEVLHRNARTLSGGLRRRLELVRSLMHRPRVLFLDEPTTGLDPQARRDLWRHVGRIRAEDGTTVLLTTHYLEEAEPADAVYVLIDGRIVESGAPDEVTGRQVRAELILDGPDRAGLRRELAALGLQDALGLPAQPGEDPPRVVLDGQNVQYILRALDSKVTRVQVVEPTLEDAYLRLLDRSRP